MPFATDVPFDASKYAYRTNFDGLPPTSGGISHRLEAVKKGYQSASLHFETADKRARESYEKDTDDGFTTEKFETWVYRNAPAWNDAKSELQFRDAALDSTALDAFGPAYQNKLQKDRSTH